MRISVVNVWFCRAAIVLGWVMMVAGWMVIAAECLLWLRNGTWLRWPLRDVLVTFPDIHGFDLDDWMVMRGADRIAAWIGSVPTSLVLILGGLGIAWNANGALEKTEARIAAETRWVRRT